MDPWEVARDAVDHAGALQKIPELAQLLELVQELEPRVILEIGADAGGCLYAWSQLPSCPVVVAVDLVEGPFRASIGPPVLHGARLVQGDSHDLATRNRVARILGATPADFLLVDGDHRYSGVKQDWLMYRSLVRPGGMIAFHDICDHPGDVIGVAELWKELRDQWPSVEIREPPFSWGGIGVLTLSPLPVPSPLRVPAR